MNLRIGHYALALCLTAPALGAALAILVSTGPRPGLAAFFYTFLFWALFDVIAIILGIARWRAPARGERRCARAAAVLGAMVLVVPVLIVIGASFRRPEVESGERGYRV